MRVLLMLAILITASCVARTGTATIIYRSGHILTGDGFYKPRAEGGMLIFEKKGGIAMTPIDVIYEAHWEEQ